MSTSGKAISQVKTPLHLANGNYSTKRLVSRSLSGLPSSLSYQSSEADVIRTSPSLQDVPGGCVRLVLVLAPLFYLEISIAHIHSLCLKPRKYLLFLGWCILGLEGELAANGPDEPRLEDLDGQVVDAGLYYYISEQGIGAILDHAVDLEVIRARSGVPSETTRTRESFRKKLLERDPFCAFTGSRPEHSEGAHIVPYRRGSEWFQGIINNRPHYEESVGDLTDISDIRNGMLLYQPLHTSFYLRNVAILKTPNHCLGIGDVPPRADRPVKLPATLAYPEDERYSLQWLQDPDPVVFLVSPNNLDIAFKKYDRKGRPSALLLHYNYGAAAVRQWGHGGELFAEHRNPARPKREAAQNTNEGGASNTDSGEQPGDEPEGMVDSGDQTQWDEDNVMLYLWGNSPVAMERHQKRDEEKSHYVEQWRQGIISIS
ncbi:hypothetical protein BS47DRAFT_1345751 [Hydnum rufescens UP504]|uniref:HNH nuclease domain-containing protein n=1 Tax=Hydnum rufescens UP504 TaxID=1448309 RepID=A0A9P6DSG7_9AGAM|nr:hypothetical protein BS47DRAFT_1345751 [Hydnum rufescens UP504]